MGLVRGNLYPTYYGMSSHRGLDMVWPPMVCSTIEYSIMVQPPIPCPGMVQTPYSLVSHEVSDHGGISNPRGDNSRLYGSDQVHVKLDGDSSSIGQCGFVHKGFFNMKTSILFQLAFISTN